MRFSNGTWYGYCIDLLELIQAELDPEDKFDYDLKESPNGKYGEKDPKTGKWDGMMGEIQEQVKKFFAVTYLTFLCASGQEATID